MYLGKLIDHDENISLVFNIGKRNINEREGMF